MVETVSNKTLVHDWNTISAVVDVVFLSPLIFLIYFFNMYLPDIGKGLV